MHGVSHLARATSRPRDENYNANAQKPSVATPETPKLRLELLGLPEETCFRKMLRMWSVYDWSTERTPRRRDLFKMARVTIGKPDSTTFLQTTPSLTILHGIEHTTWNRTIQALFMTQNCDAMFTLCAAIIYYQRGLQSVARGSKCIIDGEQVNANDSETKNHLFMAAAMLAMKFYDDLHLSNSYIAKVYRVPVKTLNKWEVALLGVLNYSLFIHQAERDQIKLDFASRVEP